MSYYFINALIGAAVAVFIAAVNRILGEWEKLLSFD